jgi:hypothetical protein
MRLKRYLLNEAGMISFGYPDTGGLCDGLDDAGDTVGAPKYEKETLQGWAGPYRRSVPVDDREWDYGDFAYTVGVSDKRHYHSSLDDDVLKKLYGNRVWSYTRQGDILEPRPLQEPKDVATEEMPEYARKVLIHSETREHQRKNLPDVVFRITRTLGDYETATGEETVGQQKKILKTDEPKKVEVPT